MRRLAPIVIVALLAAACGGSGDVGPQRGAEGGEPETTIQIAGQEAKDHGRTVVSGRAETVIEAGDVFFSPTVLVGEPEQTVTVSLANVGEVDHTFTVAEQNVDVTLRPGASDVAEVTFPDAGALLFVCRFHATAGMRGGLSVGGDLTGPGEMGGYGGYGGRYNE